MTLSRCIGTVIIVSCSIGLLAASDQPTRSRRFLQEPADIQGYLCNGWTWFYEDGHLKSCTLAQDVPFGEVHAPAGSWIALTADGKPKYLVLPHDGSILGYRCRGGGLGGNEGPTTALYPSGKLELCWVAGDQMIQGVPCAGGGSFDILTGGAPAHFYETGKLRSCKLSRDFRGKSRGRVFEQAP